jgi:hypothetical protein
MSIRGRLLALAIGGVLPLLIVGLTVCPSSLTNFIVDVPLTLLR